MITSHFWVLKVRQKVLDIKKPEALTSGFNRL